jgi:hypothetical protein
MERHHDTDPSGSPADPIAVRQAPAPNWPRRLANFAVTVAVLAVAAATFLLSNSGVPANALQGGVSPQLARVYPGVFDAVLVIACVAAVMLRGARWWARSWAWLVVIVVLAAIGFTDVLHAMAYGLRQRPTEGVVAAAPAAAVLLAFSLLLTMLRQSRSQAPDAAGSPQAQGGSGRGIAEQQLTAPMIIGPVDAVPAVAAGAVPRAPAPPIALPAAPAAASADGSDADADRAPEAPAAVPETREIAETQVIPAVGGDARDDGQGPGTAATREEPGLAAAAEETPNPTHPPTAPSETVGSPALLSTVAPETPETPETAEPAAELPAEPTLPPTQAPAPTPPAIRYASSAAADESADDYWDADVDPALAGQVYPVLTSDPDIDSLPYQPGEPQDIDGDAPPFATAPFASVPRLNRVRVTPTPPTDDED